MSRPLVLVADDEPSLVLALEVLLGRHGYATATARTGDEALTAVRGLRPDAVLLDVALPGRDGLAVCRAIGAEPGLERVAVVMLGVRGDEVEARTCRALGAAGYVPKPFANARLLEMLDAAIQARA